MVAVALLSACAGLEKGQYGVDALEFEGVEQMSDRAIARCLLTVERGRVSIPLGLSQSECNAPPFDSAAPELELFRWPWTEWPVLNPAVVEVDRRRIERWYRARGFYDARVVDVRYDPEQAAEPDPEIPEGQCDPSQEGCSATVTFVVEEGEPLRVGDVVVKGCERLPEPVQKLIAVSRLPEAGQRFDESDYDRGKTSLTEQLAEGSYAGAEIAGEVRLDHDKKLAHVIYHVTPGPSYRFGQIQVVGHGRLPENPIRAAAAIERGRPYRQSALTEVQQEVYALGAFSAVEVERKLDPSAGRVHLIVKVTPLPDDQWRLGVGITSGAMQRTEGGGYESVPQWDVHLLARYERRHVFGTLGRLRIEDRPRMIFQDSFPGAPDPRWGNLVRIRFNEPGLIEARTDTILEGEWDYGPEPFLGYERHDIMGRLSAKRGFFRRKLFATFAIEHDRSIVPNEQGGCLPPEPDEGDEPIMGLVDCDIDDPNNVVPTSYSYSFIEQNLVLDLRDEPVQPRKGLYLGLLATQSVRMPLSDFTMFGLQPEVRGYIPLPFAMVLAARFGIAANFLLSADPDLDQKTERLGPTEFRLRGGGAQGNRGFIAGELGAGPEGGLRRWESSVELRIRLGSSFGVVGFFDMGDVNAEDFFRFDRTNPAAGFGLRYLTIVGAIRFDVGFRLGRTIADPNNTMPKDDDLPLFQTPGAMHLTIGEAF